MATDTTELLRQLAIDRRPAPAAPARVGWWAAAGVLVLGVGGAVLWLVGLPSPATIEPQPSVEAAAADAATAAPAAAKPTAAAPPADRVLLNGTGYVVARRQTTVSSKTTSRVTEVLIEEGMRVEAGQVLARLDDRNERAELALAVAQQAAVAAEMAELQAMLEHATQELARARTLAADGLGSESLVDERATEVDTLRARMERTRREIDVAERRVRLQETRVDDLTVRAPFAGVVIEKSVQPGEMISPVSAGGGFTRTGIGTIVDMTSLEVEVDVNESYINRVSVGQPVEILLNAYPDRAYAGRVLAVIPTADRSKATIRVRIGFAAIDDYVLPEMGIKAAFLEP